MAADGHTFSKGERLSSRKTIQRLFTRDGTASHLAYPLVGVWFYSLEPAEFPIQALFSVPKKTFKKAVDRNTIRRRMREAYRLQKQPLKEAAARTGKYCALAFLYIAKEELPYAQIEKACGNILRKVEEGAEKNA